MQGVLIASADAAVRKSLNLILCEGRTVHECCSASDCLAVAAGQKLDYIFVDGIFEDGNGEDLAQRLHALGYGVEIIPILLNREPLYLQPFLKFGIRHSVAKPFEVQQVRAVMEQIEEVASLLDNHLPFENLESRASDNRQGAADFVSPDPWEGSREVDVREISQRFRRLLARSLRQDDLVHAFADGMQEQFDVDNVVVLMPAAQTPDFRISCGNVSEAIKEQFFIPFNSPLVTALIRLGEPIWVHERERLGRQNALTAMRYGERLGVQVLCPVLSGGRLLAIIGLSRFHRYSNSPVLLSLLRLFLTFFSKALENARLYDRVFTAEQTYRSMVDALPVGAVAVSADGRIRHLNPAAAQLLKLQADEMEDLPVERAGSRLADLARRVLAGAAPDGSRRIPGGRHLLEVTAVPMDPGSDGGALLILSPVKTPAPETQPEHAGTDPDQVWRSMSSAVAHNFKNALVPVKTCTELLPERYDSADFRNSFFSVVQESIGRMDGWIDQMLRFGSLGGQGDIPFENIEVGECLELAVASALKKFPSLKVRVDRTYDENAVVRGDSEELERVFYELVVNALDALQDTAEPRLDLRVAAGEGSLTVEIADNGRGFDKAEQAVAFAPFTTGKLSGLGLGLAYVKQVVSARGGQVGICSQGGGTKMSITLPLGCPSPKETVHEVDPGC